MSPNGFSLALFKALLDALQPSGTSTRIIITIALNNLGHADAIVDIIERRMSHVGIESADLQMLWVVVDHIMKAAPLIYPPLFAPYIPSLVADRVAWESDDALSLSLWIQRIVATWAGLLPDALWRTVFDNIRQRRTRMHLEKKGEDDVGGAGEFMNDALENEIYKRDTTATQRQLDGLKAAWDNLISLAVGPVTDELKESQPDTKRARTETRELGPNPAPPTTSDEATKNMTSSKVESDFDLGSDDEFVVGANPIVALPDIQLSITARQPRRRR